jgi:hypothetical protein
MKITIQTDADFTPMGKRRVRVVTLDRGARRIRWYVAGRIYNQLPVTIDAVELSRKWAARV